MHFDDAINLDSQKPDIIEYSNQMKSGVDTVGRMTGTVNVARSTRRGPMAYIPHNFEYFRINAQTIHMMNSNVKIKCRILIRNLVTQLLSEQIKDIKKSLQVYMSHHT